MNFAVYYKQTIDGIDVSVSASNFEEFQEHVNSLYSVLDPFNNVKHRKHLNSLYKIMYVRKNMLEAKPSVPPV